MFLLNGHCTTAIDDYVECRTFITSRENGGILSKRERKRSRGEEEEEKKRGGKEGGQGHQRGERQGKKEGRA